MTGKREPGAPQTDARTDDLARILTASVREAVASAVRETLAGLTIALDGEAVGRLTARTVDEQLGQFAWEGRYHRA